MRALVGIEFYIEFTNAGIPINFASTLKSLAAYRKYWKEENVMDLSESKLAANRMYCDTHCYIRGILIYLMKVYIVY